MGTTRPKIAVTYRSAEKVKPYAAAIQAAGGEPVLVHPSAPLSLGGLDGLLLTGGTDVDPAMYGEAPHRETDRPDSERDRMERALLDEALQQGKPVLAICRGMQLFHVAHGGKLEQHVESHSHRSGDPAQPVHSVEVAPGTLLEQAAGSVVLEVNSRHHQAAAEPVPGALRVSGRSEDGRVEALERPGHGFALAVQWHPEDQIGRDPKQLRLFEEFVRATAGGSGYSRSK